jgi:hypothetical protein
MIDGWTDGVSLARNIDHRMGIIGWSSSPGRYRSRLSWTNCWIDTESSASYWGTHRAEPSRPFPSSPSSSMSPRPPIGD